MCIFTVLRVSSSAVNPLSKSLKFARRNRFTTQLGDISLHKHLSRNASRNDPLSMDASSIMNSMFLAFVYKNPSTAIVEVFLVIRSPIRIISFKDRLFGTALVVGVELDALMTKSFILPSESPLSFSSVR